MRFCPWYPLDDADRHAPADAGVFQVRVGTGLLDYPTGKSAMIHYETAPDVKAAIAAFRAARAASSGTGWLCRHTIEMTPAEVAGAGDLYARLLREFTTRFGTPPTLPAGAGEAARTGEAAP